MHHRPAHDGTVSAHWLERLSENLKRLPADARHTAYSLLHSPWKCSSHDVLEHVPSPLGSSIVFLQERATIAAGAASHAKGIKRP